MRSYHPPFSVNGIVSICHNALLVSFRGCDGSPPDRRGARGLRNEVLECARCGAERAVKQARNVRKKLMNETDHLAKPGPILKALRLRKGWRLADVAARTGFPVSTLSNMENSKVGLNYEKMARLSKGMDVDIGVFFAEETAASRPASDTGRRSIVRKTD